MLINNFAIGSILDRLLLDTEHGSIPMAFTEDMDGEEDVKHTLEAMAACTKDDIVHWNWSIELVNSQVRILFVVRLEKGYINSIDLVLCR